MRKTWAEYKRESRMRKNLEREIRERELNNKVYLKPFSSFLAQEKRFGFSTHFLILGDDWWNFDNDEGIKSLSDDELDNEQKKAASNSLGKAELIIMVMQDIVDTLTRDVADYKKQEIESRIKEISNFELRSENPNNRLDYLEDLKQMRHRLSKTVRWILPQWRAASE